MKESKYTPTSTGTDTVIQTFQGEGREILLTLAISKITLKVYPKR